MIFVIRCLIFSCFQNHPSVCWLQPFDYLSSNLVVDSTDIDVFQKNYFEELRDQESSNYLIESTSSLSEKIPEDILTLSYDWGKLLFYICSSQSKTEWYFSLFFSELEAFLLKIDLLRQLFDLSSPPRKSHIYSRVSCQ